jgi:Zn-finger nucleic acid-binding protein
MLTSCEIRLAPLRVKADVLRCERDGVWFAGDQLTAVFARVGRKADNALPAHRSYAESQHGLDGIPLERTGPATAGLLISARRHRPRKAKVLTPINAYRDQPLACPVCANAELMFHGDRFACERCAGTFVQNAALEAMVTDIAQSLFELPAPTGATGSRACPVCSQAMIVEALEQVLIDRCGAHGIWFDANELAATLERASGQLDTGWRSWLRRLFASG